MLAECRERPKSISSVGANLGDQPGTIKSADLFATLTGPPSSPRMPPGLLTSQQPCLPVMLVLVGPPSAAGVRGAGHRGW